MPRKPRFFLPDIPVHIVIRGNNKQVVFAEEDDYLAYLSIVREALAASECRLHAYVLMSNHVHLLISSSEPTNVSRFAQYIGRKYVPFFNHKYKRTGTIWEGRFKASSIDTDGCLLACYRYIEMNPVRAGIVSEPGDYRWSSYRVNALAKGSLDENKMITPHSVYQTLGKNEVNRLANYRGLFEDVLDEKTLNEIRASVQTGTPLGNDKFKAEIEKLLKTKVGYAKRGRPQQISFTS